MNSRSANFATASRGFAWSFAASVLVLAASLAAQIALGWLLPKHDFGVYAIAVSFSNLFMVFRDGGVARWLARLPRDEFDRSCGRALCLALASSFLVAIILATVSFLIGSAYDQPQVTDVLLVLSLAFPISAYSIVGLARLQVDLRFQTMASIKLVSGLVRYGLMVWFAYLGWGPLSFAWPLVIVSALELFVYMGLTRIPLRVSDLSWQAMSQVFRASKWSLSGSFSASILRQCDYAVLGLLVSTETVGTYYFAFQIAMQPVLLFGESLRKVVLPVFSRLAGDAARESRSLRYAGTFIGLVAAPLLLLLSVTAAPLTELLWRGKWVDAVVPLQLLALAMPWHLLSVFSEALAQARGRFRLWTLAVLLRGLGLGLAAVVAVWMSGRTHLAGISAVMAAYLAISAIGEVYLLLHQLRLPFRPLLDTLSLPLLLALGFASLMLLLSRDGPTDAPLRTLLVTGTCFLASLLAAVCLFCRPTVAELFRMVRRTIMG